MMITILIMMLTSYHNKKKEPKNTCSKFKRPKYILRKVDTSSSEGILANITLHHKSLDARNPALRRLIGSRTAMS